MKKQNRAKKPRAMAVADCPKCGADCTLEGASSKGRRRVQCTACGESYELVLASVTERAAKEEPAGVKEEPVAAEGEAAAEELAAELALLSNPPPPDAVASVPPGSVLSPADRRRQARSRAAAIIVVALAAIVVALAFRTTPPGSAEAAPVAAPKPPAAIVPEAVAAREATKAVAPAASLSITSAPRPEQAPDQAARADAGTVAARGAPSTATKPNDEATLSLNQLLHKAIAAMRAGDLAGAKSGFHRVLARDPGNVEAFNGLGDTAIIEGDLKGAKRHFENAVRRSPSFFPALLSLADVQWKLGDQREARARYADIAARFPDRAPARVRQRAVEASASF